MTQLHTPRSTRSALEAVRTALSEAYAEGFEQGRSTREEAGQTEAQVQAGGPEEGPETGEARGVRGGDQGGGEVGAPEFKVTFTTVTDLEAALPAAWDPTYQYRPGVHSAYWAHIKVGWRGTTYLVVRYSTEWWVFYPNGRMWSSFASTRERAIRRAVDDAWLHLN